jgi:osmotically-inducible protein OsmY
LTRHAEDAAKHIEVAVGGDVATLHGNLDSWAEHAPAFGAAWSAPGVSSVVDQVRVRPTR